MHIIFLVCCCLVLLIAILYSIKQCCLVSYASKKSEGYDEEEEERQFLSLPVSPYPDIAEHGGSWQTVHGIQTPEASYKQKNPFIKPPLKTPSNVY